MEHVWLEGTNAQVDFYLELFSIFLSLILLAGYSLQTKASNRTEPLKRKYFIILLIAHICTMISSAILFYCVGNVQFELLSLYIAVVTYIFIFLENYLFHFFFYLSVKKPFNLGTPTKIITHFFMALSIITFLVLLFAGMCFFLDENGEFQNGNFYYIGTLICQFILLYDLILIMINRKKLPRLQLFAWIIYALLPIVALPIGVLISPVYLSLATFLSLLIIYMTINVIDNQQSIESENQSMKNTLTLSKAQTDIMISQIQPHFLFNALASISALCYFDSKTAQKATNKFADYLRMNLNSIRNATPISFAKELEHVETYLWLEQLRFNERLNVEYDIKEKDFSIPPLCIQPIVENAVKHGVCVKTEGGHIFISTAKNDKDFLITIKDDGVGFSLSKLDSLKADHKGLKNCEQRISNLCHGYIEIDSKVNEGTTVIVHIPQNPDKKAKKYTKK